MNVQRITKVIEAYQSTSNRPVAKTQKGKDFKDEIQISLEARLLDYAKKAAANTPDIRENKINDIVKKIESGTYKVSADSIAKKMLE